MTKSKVVMPGDQVSTSEELLPGDGTFEEDGVIRASRFGTYVVDEKHKRAVVQPLTSIPTELRTGDTVLAHVTSVRSNMIIAEVMHVIGKARSISGETDATLRVSEIANSYIKDPSSEFSTGDIFRARVAQVKPSLQLITKDSDLGVIKANCTNCKKPLTKKGNVLECANCGNKERRRTAADYGDYEISKF